MPIHRTFVTIFMVISFDGVYKYTWTQVLYIVSHRSAHTIHVLYIGLEKCFLIYDVQV